MPVARRSRRLYAIAGLAGLVIAGAVAWQVAGRDDGPARPTVAAGRDATVKRPGVMRRIDGQWRRVDPRDPSVGWVDHAPAGMVRVEGKVYDLDKGEAVAGVEVVFAGAGGESTSATGADGRYRIDVAPGAYRAFARGDGVLSIGPRVEDRLPTVPQPGVAGVPDEQIAPVVMLVDHEPAVDLPVVRGGTVNGRVVDASGNPIAGAVVRALGGNTRPVLGTDLAETAADGRFQLELPVGHYGLDASHPAFAGVRGTARAVDVTAGGDTSTELTMLAGCIISGKVVRERGGPSGDGAIERQFGPDESAFSPAGKIDADGRFRWTTLEEGSVVLRAWPWASPHSEPHDFSCRDGERFENVVFTIPDRGPDIAGTVVGADGQPARYAYLDVFALDPGGVNQQERADGDGRWGVYAMPPGRYRITVFDPERGAVTQTVEAPAHDVKLQLGGTGGLGGRVEGMDSGSFTAVLGGCDEGAGREERVRRQLLVPVHAGSYRIERLPACTQRLAIHVPTKTVEESITIEAGQVARLDLDLAPRKRKVVTGTVSAPDGRPAAGVEVVTAYGDQQARATTDAQGRFRIETYAGEGIYAYQGSRRAFAMVGEADVPEERVDLQLGEAAEDE